KDAVWFRFGEKEARFGLQEFSLVTGFKIATDDENAYEVPNNNSSLLQLFKKKKGKIKRSDLLEKFLTLKKKEDAETKYKLGLVIVLEHVVLSSELETLVDERWFNLVEDLEKFNSYPSGNLSYQQTVKLFKRTSFGKGKNPESINYSLHGFPLAIMIWAFEALPDLGREFAQLNTGVQLPRMYCWKMEKQLRALTTFFERAEIQVRRTLEPSSYECESSYFNELGIIVEEEDSGRHDEDEEGTATKDEGEGSASSKGDDDDDDVDDEEEEEE
ncbi:hypothetical protein STAS_26681, partial [Striga asiatica]